MEGGGAAAAVASGMVVVTTTFAASVAGGGVAAMPSEGGATHGGGVASTPPPPPPVPPVPQAPAPPRRLGSRDVTEFHSLDRIGEGTYGTVTRARDPRTGRLVALKKIRLVGETEGFPAWAVREITALQLLRHPNVVCLQEVATSRPSDQNRGLGDVFLVFEYVENDLAGLIR
jgi:serine/threonine protein kinase